MRIATAKVGAAVGATLMAAATSVMVGAPTASAQPAGQQVRYTLVSGGAYQFDLFYVTAQPPSMEAFNADAYAYAKREKVNLAPGVPWVFETTMEDPNWAILQVSSTAKGGQGAPNAHCDIAVDGAILTEHNDPYNVFCKLGKW